MTTSLFVAEWALRSSILIVTGALFLWTVRLKDASVRLALWTAILCASLAIPFLSAALPALPLIAPHPAKLIQPVPIALDNAQSFPIPALQTSTGSSPRFDAMRIAVMTYALIAGILLLRLVVGIGFGMRLLRASRETGKMSEGVEIRDSDRVSVPVTLGIVRPVIVLPTNWRDWDQKK